MDFDKEYLDFVKANAGEDPARLRLPHGYDRPSTTYPP